MHLDVEPLSKIISPYSIGASSGKIDFSLADVWNDKSIFCAENRTQMSHSSSCDPFNLSEQKHALIRITTT